MDNERKGLYNAIFAKLDEYSLPQLHYVVEEIYKEELENESSSIRGIH